MSWLAEWLRQIIFIVLLAGIIEMLLPSRSMERYVKLVLSLLVLLTLLSPILKLLDGSPVEKLQQAIEKQLNSTKAAGQSSLEQILKQGEQLRQSSLEDSLKWAGSETAQQMKTQIEANTGLNVKRVAVTIQVVPAKETEAKDQEQGIRQNYDKPVISSVKVYLNPAAEDTPVMAKTAEPNRDSAFSSSDMSQGTIQIPGVDPIQIGVDQIRIGPKENGAQGPEVTEDSSDAGGAGDGSKAGTQADGDQAVLVAPDTAEGQEITRMLGSSWGVAGDRIEIYQLQADRP
ncbi:hypothetical protein AWM70_10275 [Paenibacillus yonginensis]|uniref:Stage III sporulation protein AF n=1 Tax=Paenibacillus yonginensis TaxID=1462996 RepID=A0A1B1N0I0_9BACL|nr:stage III sporulation protein AF [Paenibacillus yonginensis]ANS74937.1 hypothetical protein AWM70_10275 [Paenibacillus yonginensis]